MAKMCKYQPDKRCYRSSCSVFNDVSGKVSVCPLHGNPSGLLMRRKVVA